MSALNHPTVLDLGCGGGRQLVDALRAGATRGVGIDLAPNMVELARSHAAEAGFAESIECRLGDASNLVTDERFDLVWALGVFDYVRDPLPLLRRMSELSRNRVVGTFRRLWAVRSPFRWAMYRARGCPIYLHTRRSLQHLAADAGLTDVQIHCPNATFYYLEARGVGSS